MASQFQNLILKYENNHLIYRKKSEQFLYAIVILLFIGVFAVVFSRELARVDSEIAKSSQTDELSKLNEEREKLNGDLEKLSMSIDSINESLGENKRKEFAYGWQSIKLPSERVRINDLVSYKNVIYCVGANGLISKIEKNKPALITTGQTDYYTGVTSNGKGMYISSLEGNIYELDLGSKETVLVASKDKSITSISSSESAGLIIATTIGGFFINRNTNDTWDYIKVRNGLTFNDAYVKNEKIWLVGVNGVLIQYDLHSKKFNQINLPTKSNLYSICGNSSNSTLAISGSDGVVLISKDNGNSWSLKQSRNFSRDLYSISINQTGKYLCAVGANNSLLVSRNNGDDWVVDESHINSEGTLFSCIFMNNNDKSLIIGGEGSDVQFSNENHLDSKLANKLSQHEIDKERIQSRMKEITVELESQQYQLQKSSDLLFHIATNSTRLAIILLIVFLVRILLNQHRYYKRLSVFYSSRSDVLRCLDSLKLSADERKGVLAILLPDAIEMGTAPDLDYSKRLDFMKNYRQ